MAGLPLMSVPVVASSATAVSILNGTGTNPSLNFSPASFTVEVGVNNTVIFTNNDATFHSVTFSSAPSGVVLSSISTANLTAGESFTVTLTIPGTYDYHCLYHPWMKGTIEVVSPGAMPTATSTTSAGGGVPEFPFQAGAVMLITALVVISYLVLARRRTDFDPGAQSRRSTPQK